MAPILKISDLHKHFGPLEVLRGISLDVDPGQVVALVGASGSGKTTLLRCVNALEDYHKGSISLGDEQIGYQDLNGRRVGVRYSDLRSKGTNPNAEGVTVIITKPED